MNERFTPSLEHVVLVQIAATLWNKKDIKALIANYTADEILDGWYPIEEQVNEKVSLIPQPQLLKDKIFGLIRPISLQILDWLEDYYKVTGHFAKNLPDKFYFSPRGTLDRVKTTKALMGNEAVGISERYQMACAYCLQDDIKTLWKKMPEVRRRYFYNEKSPRYVRQSELVIFWTYNIEGQVSKMADLGWDNERFTPYQWAFEFALRKRSKDAVEYFLNKLNPEEREASLRYAMSDTLQLIINWRCVDFDTLCFLLSELNEEQQLELFKRNPRQFMWSFLQWPRQGLFMAMMNRVEAFLNDEHYYFLFFHMIEKVDSGFKDYDYQKLFGELWLRSDATRKKYLINECYNDDLLFRLLRIGDTKNVSLIAGDATVEEKENIVNDWGSYFCSYFATCGNWDTIQFFLSEFISSKEKLLQFKNKCKKNEWNPGEKFFRWLDDLIRKWN